jgi:hypothetical protein
MAAFGSFFHASSLECGKVVVKLSFLVTTTIVASCPVLFGHIAMGCSAFLCKVERKDQQEALWETSCGGNRKAMPSLKKKSVVATKPSP